MGADLYIDGLNDPTWEKWLPHFDAAVKARDATPESSPEYAPLSEHVHYYYEKMTSEGYFRDSYNYWEVLPHFGFSWWGDVIPRLTATSYLPVEEAVWLLHALEDNREYFRQSIGKLPKKHRPYFEGRAQALEEFLKTAIERKEPIHCSL